MKWVLGKTALWVGLTLLSVAFILGPGQSQPASGATLQTQSAGAAILERSCGSCHGADVIAGYHYESAEGYRDIVNSMIGAGAQVSPQEMPVLVDYLFATYGKQGAAPAAAADPGKAILESACTACHGLEGLANHVYPTKDPYEGLVRNMIGYGASVTDAQIPALVDYMFKTYGKPPADAPAAAPAAAANDPGKAILESACTVCHGLEGLANHVYETKEPYESLVRNMMAYGANVPEAQVPALVDYMFKTYGKAPVAADAAPVAAANDPGKAILDSACTVCHGLEGLANHVYTEKGPYEQLVRNMIGYGASVSEAQIGPLTDYMLKTYGKH